MGAILDNTRFHPIKIKVPVNNKWMTACLIIVIISVFVGYCITVAKADKAPGYDIGKSPQITIMAIFWLIIPTGYLIRYNWCNGANMWPAWDKYLDELDEDQDEDDFTPTGQAGEDEYYQDETAG